MLKGNREMILSAVALLIAFSLTALLWPARPSLPTPDTDDTAATHYRPGGADCQPGAPIPLEGFSQKEIDRCAEDAEQYRLKANDLVQQTRSANAAEAQAFLGYDMTRMVLIGTLGGIFTLCAAIAAALYAREAAEAAGRSVAHATKTSADELRPWVQIEIVPYSIRLTKEEALVRYGIRLKNLGKLPATSVFADAQIYDFSRDMDDIPRHFDSEFIPDPVWTPRTILPQGEVEIQGTAARNRDELAIVESAGEAQIRPVLAVRTVYQWDGGKGKTCQSFQLIRSDSQAGEGRRYIPVGKSGRTARPFAVVQTWFDDVC